LAQQVGGDHTIDISRLLRIPGSMNRKDERNGREPIPTQLIECDPTRKYALSVFEPLKIVSPDSQRAKQIESMPLPQPRKMTASKADKLAELVAASSLAEAGRRSETDFSLCCYAVRQGIDREEVWRQVEPVGKFSEQGRRYFDHTWMNAEDTARFEVYEKLQKKANGDAGPSEVEDTNEMPPDDEIDTPPDDTARPTIRVDPAYTPVGDTMHQITNLLLKVGGCYSRVDQLVIIRDETIAPILSCAELAGLLNHHAEFYFIRDEGGEYKPLPSSYGNTWLHHPGERYRLPNIKLFTRNPVYTDDWRLTTPGYDPASEIYYAGPEVPSREDTHHLDRLLRDFCFKTHGDRTNYIGMLLTVILVPRFIGSKPAVLFNGNQPGLGKTVLGQIISIVRDGQPVETATYNPNDEEFEKRLGSIVRRGATTIIVDNAIGHLRRSGRRWLPHFSRSLLRLRCRWPDDQYDGRIGQRHFVRVRQPWPPH